MTNDDKVLEMSRYIDIEMYDKYEEEHPFYRDMSWRMIQMGRQHRTDLNGNRSRGSTGRWRVLELGAGTGLFTKRLAEEQDWDVTAVELDSTCHDVLRRKMSPYSNVTCWRADSRSF